MVHVWYPIATGSASEAAPYVSGVELLRSKIDDSYFEILRTTIGHSRFEKTPTLDRSERHPVIIFSHGSQMSGLLYTAITEDLASHGYVVVCVDHPQDVLFTIFPDGRVATYSEPKPGAGTAVKDPEERFRRMIDKRVSEISSALGQMPTLFPGQLDLSHLAVVGHSSGGVAASRICETDERVNACANLDGRERGAPFYLAADQSGPIKPFLYFAKPLHAEDGDSRNPRTTLGEYDRQLAAVIARDKQRMESLNADSYTLTLTGATHDTFSDVPLLLPSTSEESAANRKRIKIVREYLRAFLDNYLRDEPTTLLDQANPAYPEMEIVNHTVGRRPQ